MAELKLIVPKVCCGNCITFHEADACENDMIGNPLCIACSGDERIYTHKYCVGCSQMLLPAHFRFAVSFYAGASEFDIYVCIDCEIYRGALAFFFQAHNLHTPESIGALVASSQNAVNQSHLQLYNLLLQILGLHIPELVIDYMY